MHARVSTFEGSRSMTESEVEEGVRLLREQVMPAAKQMEGFRGVLSLADRSSGKEITITFWESEEAMRASEEAANRLREQAAEALQSRIGSVERFEVLLSEVPSGTLAG